MKCQETLSDLSCMWGEGHLGEHAAVIESAETRTIVMWTVEKTTPNTPEEVYGMENHKGEFFTFKESALPDVILQRLRRGDVALEYLQEILIAKTEKAEAQKFLLASKRVNDGME